MRKENDLILNMIDNPSFSIADFKAVGLNAGNTSLETEDAYKNHSKIKDNPLFQKKNGEFDDLKFHTYYQNAQQALAYLGDDKYKEDLIKLTTFHRDNIFAPAEQRRKGPDFLFILLPNPDRTSFSTIRLGKETENPLSLSEIALTLKVLANPAEAYDKNGNLDESKAIWHDSPNDSWFTDFFDTRVLAQWDSDGEHIDPITKLKVHHSKGLLKTNSNGTYYYENLDGRDVYGKRVLNKFDTLTTDGSALNKYDFFDSDDKEQKSIMGTTMKNLALVGSMYIPYVGPVIAGLSIATLAAGMLGTLGKMLSGSNSPIFSGMEGWAKSVNRQEGKTEYAQNPDHQWCWENFIGLVGDSLALFKEQRFLFQVAPAIFKGKYGIIDETLDLDALIKKEAALLSNPLDKLAAESGSLQKFMDSAALSNLRATNNLNSYIKGYLKIGEILSKGYMTGITVADTYGEAKNQGASDVEATMLTLGYGAAEAALLNTGLGEWLFPELRYNKMHQQAVLKALTKALTITLEAEQQIAKQTLLAGKTAAKRQYIKDLFNVGKKAALDLWTASKSTGARTLSNTIANASGEGFEEVSEELLADLSKGCFNVIGYLRGDDTRLLAFDIDWSLNNPETNWQAMFNRYAMNFAGGFIGGGIAGLNLKLIKAIKDLGNMTYDLAVQQLIYMTRNKLDGELNSFLKTLDKTEVGNPNWSATKYTTDKDGNVIWQLAEGSDNQDTAAKNMIRTLLKMIDEILTGNGLNISDESLLAQQADLLGDAKYTVLMKNSTAVGRMLQRFNTLGAEIAKNELLLRQGTELKTDKLEREERKENEETLDKAAKEGIKEELKKLKLEKDELLSGKLTGLYIDAALFELTPMINMDFLPVSFSRYAESVSKRKYADLSEQEINLLKKDYDSWRTLEKGDLVLIASQVFKDIVNASSDVILNHALEYADAKNDPVLKTISNFHANGIDGLIMSRLSSVGFNGDLYEALAQNIVDVLPLEVSRMLALASGDTRYSQLVDILNQFNLIDPKSVSVEDYQEIERQTTNKFNKIFSDILYDKLQTITEPIIRLGYLNSEAKHNLILALNSHREFLIEQLDVLDKNRRDITSKSLTPELRAEAEAFNNDLQLKIDEISKKLSNISELTQKIAELPHTPIEKSLNEFSIAVTGQPTNVSEILAKVNNSLDPSLANLSEYTMGEDLSKDIDEALRVIDYYRTALDSARTDNGDMTNLFGYAHTINQLNKKLGTEHYQELPEIDAEIADVLKLDLLPLRDKLIFAKNIYNINLGAKIHLLENASLNADFLLHKKAQKLRVAIPDDWEGKDKFIQTIDNLSLLNSYQQDKYPKPKDIKEEDKKKIQAESLQIEDAIHELFSKNITVLKIKNFLGNNHFDLYGITKDILNENTTDLDDNGFIWWIATRAAVKASDFYKRYSTIITTEGDKPIAPIAPLVLATYTNYASVVNGNVFDMFMLAYREAIKDDWNAAHTKVDAVTGEKIPGYDTITYRKEILTRLAPFTKMTYRDIEERSSDNSAKFVLLNIIAPKYSHITFTEGISGAGKTNAVIKSTYELLKKYHKDLLKNVWIIHGANKTEGEKYKKTLGAEEATVLSYKEFMQKISPEWKPLIKYKVENGVPIYKGMDIQLNSDGEYASSHKIATDIKPSLILIDELTNFNLFDLDDINKAAAQIGILVLGAGDTNQSGVYGEYYSHYDEKGTPTEIENLKLFNVNFVRSFKLGVSMRPGNNHKAVNFNRLQLFMQDPLKYKLVDDNALSVCVNDEGIFGDLVFDIETSDEYALDNPNKKSDKTLGELIDLMINTLKPEEHIAYITNNPDNKLAQFLVNKYGDKVKIYPNGIEFDQSSQGKEFLYSIIDLDSDLTVYPAENGRNDIYTGLTRAIQGDIVLTHTKNEDDNSPFIMDGEILIGESIPSDTYINTEISKEALVDYSNKVKKNYEELTTLASGDIEYVPRTPITSTESTPPPPAGKPDTGDTKSESSSGTLTPIELVLEEFKKYSMKQGDSFDIYKEGEPDPKIPIFATFTELTTDVNGNILFNYESEGIINVMSYKLAILYFENDATKDVTVFIKHKEVDPDEIRRQLEELEKLNQIRRGNEWLTNKGFEVTKFISVRLDNGEIKEGYIQEVIGDPVSKSFLLKLDTTTISELELNNALLILDTSISKDDEVILNAWNALKTYCDLKFRDTIKFLAPDRTSVLNTYIIRGILVDNGEAVVVLIDADHDLPPRLESISNIYTWMHLENPLIVKELAEKPEITINPTLIVDDSDLEMNPTNPEDFVVETTEEEEHNALENTVNNDPPSPKVNINSSKADIETLVYSNFSFETGVAPCEMNEVPNRSGIRIDSVNGLLSLDEKLHHKPRTLEEYVQMISDIREVIFGYRYIDDITKNLTYIIEKYYEKEIENNTLVNNPKVVFGFRICNPKEKEKGNKYDAYNHPAADDVLFADGSKKAKHNHLSYIGIRIGFEGLGDVLELPLLNFTNPFTLVLAKDLDGNYLFNDIVEDIIGLPDGLNGKVAKDLYDKYRTTKLDIFTKYETFFKLLYQYSITNNAWISFTTTDSNNTPFLGKDGTEWTPVKDMACIGPKIYGKAKNTTLQKGGVYFDPDYELEVKLVTIRDMKDRKNLNMSRIIYSKTGTIEDLDGNILTLNGETLILKPGHQFILYTFASEDTLRDIYNVNNIYDAWIRQLQDPTLPKRIGMAYVLSPQATIEEFIAYNTLEEQQRHSNIRVGNDFDGYKICRELFTNLEFIDKLKDLTVINPSVINVVKKLVDYIEDKVNEVPEKEKLSTIVNLLSQTIKITGVTNASRIYGIGSIEKGMQCKDFFLRILAAIINPIRTVGGQATHILNPDVLALVKQYALKSLQSLRYHPDAEYKMTGKESFFGTLGGPSANFFGIFHDEDYAILDINGDNKYYTVFGSISEDIYLFNPDSMLDYILNSLTGVHLDKTGKWHSSKNTENAYLNGEVTCKKAQVEETSEPQPVLNPNTAKVTNTKYILKLAGLTVPDDIGYLSDTDLYQLQLQAVKSINESEKPEFAVIIDGKAKRYASNDLESGVYSLFNNINEYIQDPFTTVEQYTSDADGNVYLFATSNGYSYDIVIKNNEDADVIPKPTSHNIRYAINEDNFEDFKNAFVELDLKITDMTDNNWIKVNTLEELMSELSSDGRLYDYLDTDEIDDLEDAIMLKVPEGADKALITLNIHRLLKLIKQLLCIDNINEDEQSELCDAFKFTIFNI